MGIALWGARGRCCALRVGSKEFRWWATLLGVCLVGTGPTCAGLPPPAPTSPTADPFRPLHFPCSFSAPKAAPYSGHVFARAGAVALRHGRGRGAVVFPGVASRGFAPPCAARNCFREVRRGRRGCARLLPP